MAAFGDAGSIPAHIVAANSTNLTQIKPGQGFLDTIVASTNGTANSWLKIYDALSANVTVGTTVPVLTIGIPGNTANTNTTPTEILFTTPIRFQNGISIAITLNPGDADATAVAASACVVSLGYH